MKKTITINVDAETLVEAKKIGHNISKLCNVAIIKAAKPIKKDFAEKSLKIVCSVCSEEIIQGYRCPLRKIAICDDCHPYFNMKQCNRIESQKEHVHTRFGIKLEPLVDAWTE